MNKKDLRAGDFHPWEEKDYCPLELRDLRKVLADARPARVPGEGLNVVYRWWMSGGDWWGVCPPNGIVPENLIRKLVELSGTRDFATEKEARQALQRAAAALDPRIPAGG